MSEASRTTTPSIDILLRKLNEAGKNRNGRFCGPQLCNLAVQALRAGAPLDTIAVTAGVCRTSILRWEKIESDKASKKSKVQMLQVQEASEETQARKSKGQSPSQIEIVVGNMTLRITGMEVA